MYPNRSLSWSVLYQLKRRDCYMRRLKYCMSFGFTLFIYVSLTHFPEILLEICCIFVAAYLVSSMFIFETLKRKCGGFHDSDTWCLNGSLPTSIMFTCYSALLQNTFGQIKRNLNLNMVDTLVDNTFSLFYLLAAWYRRIRTLKIFLHC